MLNWTRQVVGWCSVGAVAVWLVGCGKPPEEQIMAAEDSIKAAVAAGAEEMSPKLLEKARTYLQDAKMLTEQGHYGEARKKAEFAAMRAGEARRNAAKLGGHKAEGGAAPEGAGAE